MFRRRTEPVQPTSEATPSPTERITSVLSSGINWQGQLAGTGGVRIEGTFEGDVNLRGLLVVGENGRLTCQQLRANVVIIAGTVRGDITAQKLEIRSTGRVWGNVITTSFSTEEGAFLRGQITMEEKLDLEPVPVVETTGDTEDVPEEIQPET